VRGRFSPQVVQVRAHASRTVVRGYRREIWAALHDFNRLGVWSTGGLRGGLTPGLRGGLTHALTPKKQEARSKKLERVPSFAWSLRGQKSVRSVREKLARSEDPHRRGADQPAPRAPPRSAAPHTPDPDRHRSQQPSRVQSWQARSTGQLPRPCTRTAPPAFISRGGGRGYAVTVAWSPNWPAPSRPHHAGPIVGLTMPAPEPVASLAASTGQGGVHMAAKPSAALYGLPRASAGMVECQPRESHDMRQSTARLSHPSQASITVS
jgi:hypothetical protein